MTSRLLFEDETGIAFLVTVLGVLVLSIGSVIVIMTLSPPSATRANRLTQERGTALRTGITRFRNTHLGPPATYPSSLDALVTDDASGCVADNDSSHATTYKTVQGWCGPYVDVPFSEFATEYKVDGWGTEFQFNSTTGALSSCGPDRTCGNSDDLTIN